MSNPNNTTTKTFEDALAELQKISDEMNNDESVDLDLLVKHYQRAKELHQHCSKLLAMAENKIKELDNNIKE